ncbi:hypothetical protein PPL_05676 [Heterostelium album PN500]|uniref:CBS domain-containing protein n=1 Tax=Heterostelium pallidum (strain ATCC 26659 / Pp 5 / PN500) TaxID=670386 RepID=D3BAU5_HETP5|nr:hypothetical protein PPL_05676 [Heterostelium album PN500]EFA81682.1 hypothetical protein PPL_05676 [Heterostelium album PN500]|eukprot:XP_020433799.1 hypothetical protein PPL_05676 [Heterostelium album PN500]
MTTQYSSLPLRSSGQGVSTTKDFIDLLTTPLENTTLLKKMVTKPLLWVDLDDSVHKAFDVICSQKVLSIPVFSKSENRWVSMLDVKDICTHIVSLFDHDNNLKASVPDDYTVRYLLTTDTGEFIRPCPIVRRDCRVLDILNLFDKKIHRICVSTGPNPKDIQIISEMSIIKWIDQNRSKLGPLFEKTVKKRIISIANSKLAIDAFRKLSENNIYGMPIVSETDDELVDSISVIDIKVIIKVDYINKLKQPLSEFYIPTIGKTNVSTLKIIGYFDE